MKLSLRQRNKLIDFGSRILLVALLTFLTWSFIRPLILSTVPAPPEEVVASVVLNDPEQILGDEALGQLKALDWPAETRVLVRVRPNALPIADDDPQPLLGATDGSAPPACGKNSDCLVRAYPDYFNELYLNALYSLIPRSDVFVVDIVRDSADVAVFWGGSPHQRSAAMDSLIAGELEGFTPVEDDHLSYLSPDTFHLAVEGDMGLIPGDWPVEQPESDLRGVLRLMVAHGDLNTGNLTRELQRFLNNTGSGTSAIREHENQVRLANRAPLAVSFTAFFGWWLLVAAASQTVGRTISRSRHCLGTSEKRRQALEKIQRVRTEALLDTDQVRLEAVAAPSPYQATLLARAEQWVSTVTLLSRLEVQFQGMQISSGSDEGGLHDLVQMGDVAEVVQRGRAVLSADATALANPTRFDPSSHPCVATLRAGIEAAEALATQLPVYKAQFDEAVAAASAHLATAPAAVSSEADVVKILRAWDGAARELALCTTSLPEDDLYVWVERKSWSPVGRRRMRPEVKAIRLPARERCLDFSHGSAAQSKQATAQSKQEAAQSKQEAAQSKQEAARAATAFHSEADEKAQTARAKAQYADFVSQKRFSTPISLPLTPVGIVVAASVALTASFLVLRAGSVTKPSAVSLAQQTIWTFWLALLFGVGAMVLVTAVRNMVRRRAQRRTDLRAVLQSALMGEDALALDVLQLQSQFPQYANNLHLRFQEFLECRDELVRLAGFGVARSDERLDDYQLTLLAQVVRAQMLSLWRVGDILRQRPNWMKAWHWEAKEVLYFANQAESMATNPVISSLTANLEWADLSPTQALLQLDDFTQRYRLARLVRALPVQTRSGDTYHQPISEHLALLSETPKALREVAQLVPPENASYYVVSDSAGEALQSIKTDPNNASMILAAVFLVLSGTVLPLSLSDPADQVGMRWNFDRSDEQAPPAQVVIVDLAGRISEPEKLRAELEKRRFPVPVNIVIGVCEADRPVAPLDSEQLAAVAPFATAYHCAGITNDPRGNTVAMTITADQVVMTTGALTEFSRPGLESVEVGAEGDVTDTIVQLFDGAEPFTLR